jgi:hypothetical protein
METVTGQRLALSESDQVTEFIRSNFEGIKSGNSYCELFGDGTIVLVSLRADQARRVDGSQLPHKYLRDRTQNISPA